MRRWLAISMAATLALIIALIWMFPRSLIVVLRPSTPPAWDSSLAGLSHEDIVKRLGEPDEDMSAKDYQSWISRTWWGAMQLRIAFADCCKPQSRPTDVRVIFHLNGRYRPIEVRTLSRSNAGL
jgi:hypothetical protein